MLYFQNDALVKTAFLQLLGAVEHWHAKGLYHRDLRPKNTVCSADGSCLYLTGFGLATNNSISTSTGSAAQSTCAPVRAPFSSPRGRAANPSFSSSPECIGQDPAKTGHYSARQRDIWVLGILFIIMTTGVRP
jgi:serine/threonine protein kinase